MFTTSSRASEVNLSLVLTELDATRDLNREMSRVRVSVEL